MEAYATGADPAAFRQLFDRHGPRLYGWFLRSTHSDAVANDLVQQTFLNLHRARRDYRIGARFRPWLYAIGANTRREYFRKTQRRAETGFDPAVHDSGVAPDASTAEARAVRRALQQLPDNQRDVLLLHWYEGFSFREIGEMLGASTSAVKVRAHRAYKALRATLGGADEG